METTTQSFDIKKTHVGKDGKLVTTTKSVMFQVQQKVPKKSISKERQYTHDVKNYHQRGHHYAYQTNNDQRQDFDALIQNMAQYPQQLKSFNGKVLTFLIDYNV
jgi:hypothetical protein